MKINRKELDKNIFYWAIVILPVIQFIIFYICVNFNSVLMAFKNYAFDENGNLTESFAGFANFKQFIGDFKNDFKLVIALKNSLKLYGVNLLVGIPLALIFSFYFFKKAIFHDVFKVIVFMPTIVSSIAMAMMFNFLVNKGVPAVVERLWHKEVLGLLDGTNTSVRLATIFFYNVWIGFGANILLYSGAMGSINPSVIEAGQMDGMNSFQEFYYIILPSIYPTISTFLVVGIAGVFINQADLYTFYGGAADPSISTLGYILFQKVVNNTASKVDFPYAAAGGLVFTLIAAPITILAKTLLEKFGPSED